MTNTINPTPTIMLNRWFMAKLRPSVAVTLSVINRELNTLPLSPEMLFFALVRSLRRGDDGPFYEIQLINSMQLKPGEKPTRLVLSIDGVRLSEVTDVLVLSEYEDKESSSPVYATDIEGYLDNMWLDSKAIIRSVPVRSILPIESKRVLAAATDTKTIVPTNSPVKYVIDYNTLASYELADGRPCDLSSLDKKQADAWFENANNLVMLSNQRYDGYLVTNFKFTGQVIAAKELSDVEMFINRWAAGDEVFIFVKNEGRPNLFFLMQVAADERKLERSARPTRALEFKDIPAVAPVSGLCGFRQL